jgi:chaperonin GroEL
MTGAKFYSKDLGMAIKDIKIEDLGKAKKVTVKKDSTTLSAAKAARKTQRSDC